MRVVLLLLLLLTQPTWIPRFFPQVRHVNVKKKQAKRPPFFFQSPKLPKPYLEGIRASRSGIFPQNAVARIQRLLVRLHHGTDTALICGACWATRLSTFIIGFCHWSIKRHSHNTICINIDCWSTHTTTFKATHMGAILRNGTCIRWNQNVHAKALNVGTVSEMISSGHLRCDAKGHICPRHGGQWGQIRQGQDANRVHGLKKMRQSSNTMDTSSCDMITQFTMLVLIQDVCRKISSLKKELENWQVRFFFVNHCFVKWVKNILRSQRDAMIYVSAICVCVVLPHSPNHKRQNANNWGQNAPNMWPFCRAHISKRCLKYWIPKK